MKFLINVVLDRSGSMSSCHAGTIEGFNAFLADQKADTNGEAYLSLTLFDEPVNKPDIIHRFTALPITSVKNLGSADNPYEPRGGTPLLDAVGVSVRATESIAKDYDKVLFLIITDGYENASREWTTEKLRELIEEKRAAGWDFVFMGADQDAWSSSAAAMAVPAGSTQSFSSTSTPQMFATTSGSVSMYRASGGTTGSDFYQTGGTPLDTRSSGSAGPMVVPPRTPKVSKAPVAKLTCPSCKQPYGQHAPDCRMVSWRQ